MSLLSLVVRVQPALAAAVESPRLPPLPMVTTTVTTCFSGSLTVSLADGAKVALSLTG
jgi:hypothetical protein